MAQDAQGSTQRDGDDPEVVLLFHSFGHATVLFAQLLGPLGA